MAENNSVLSTVPTELLRAIINSSIDVSTFSGAVHQDGRKWIDEFDRKTRLLNDKDKFDTIKFYLEKTALFWFKDEIETDESVRTFSALKDKFISKFVCKDVRMDSLRKLRKLKYCSELNRVSTYVVDFRHYYKLAHPRSSDAEMIADLFETFPEEFRSKFLNVTDLEDVKDLKEFGKIAERVERSVGVDKQLEKKLFAAKSNDSLDLKKLLEEIKALRTEVSSLKEQKSSRAKQCFKCHGEWPLCGCGRKCRQCQGSWPSCGCGSKTAATKPKQAEN